MIGNLSQIILLYLGLRWILWPEFGPGVILTWIVFDSIYLGLEIWLKKCDCKKAVKLFFILNI
jgi:hypothetical protein